MKVSAPSAPAILAVRRKSVISSVAPRSKAPPKFRQAQQSKFELSPRLTDRESTGDGLLKSVDMICASVLRKMYMSGLGGCQSGWLAFAEGDGFFDFFADKVEVSVEVKDNCPLEDFYIGNHGGGKEAGEIAIDAVCDLPFKVTDGLSN